MELELHCPECGCLFGIASTTDAQYANFLPSQFPTFALGDGQTFEDILYTSFAHAGPAQCPDCDHSVPVTERDLNGLALELLAQW